MDFHGMKRKELQTLCKKHGIAGTLKNYEMASRLASVYQKETTMEKKIPPEDSVEAYGIKDENVVVSGEAKKVKFSPDVEVFEFTRSVKKCKRKNVRKRSQGSAQDLQQDGIKLRRSKRNVAKSIAVAVAGANESESNAGREVSETKKECHWSDVTQVTELMMALDQFEDKVTGPFSSANQSEQLVDTDDKEDELVKDNVKEVPMGFEVHETGKYHRKDVQVDLKVEKVPRRSKRFANDISVQTNTQVMEVQVDLKVEKVLRRSKRLVNDFDVQTNTQEKDVQVDLKVEKVHRRSKRFVNDLDVQTSAQDQRRSTRLKNNAAKPSMGSGESDGSAKESKEERKAKQSKGSVAVNSLEGEPVKNKTKEASTDCEVQTTEKAGRRFTRLTANLAKSKAGPFSSANQSKQLDDKEDELVKNNVKDDPQVKKVPRRSKRFVNDIKVQTNTQDQRQSIRLKTSVAKPFMGGGASD